ncbi:39S ribosomal protein L21, mitochondrial [Armadillidium vulgare]|nr:39S ribosomal protein L21, mitochondrial [Armadillidium vulgare]
MSPEDRVNEIIGLQAEGRIRIPLVEPLEAELNSLLTVEDLELSETARNLMTDFKDLKEFITSLVADIEKEAGSISQDQKFFADYITGVKEVKPWQFDENCLSKKEKLEAAGKARSSMEKPSASENLYDPLTQKWGQVKKSSEERIKKITTLVNTWQELQKTTEDLAIKMNEVPKQDEPNIAELEKVFNSMKELFTKKKDLLAKV